MPPPEAVLSSVRLDVWLDVSCLFRTRSEAQKACKGGKVEVNDRRANPHREIRVGDEILITRPMGRRQRVAIRVLTERHLPKAQARELFRDLTPPPSADEIELRRLARLWGRTARPRRAGSRGRPDKTDKPDKRQRRLLRRLKGV